MKITSILRKKCTKEDNNKCFAALLTPRNSLLQILFMIVVKS